MQGRPLTLFGMRAFLLSSTMQGSPYHCGIFSFPGIANVVAQSYSCSPSFPIRQGVRQGAVLSPLLHSLFVGELLVDLSASGHGVSLDGVHCGALMYADDLVWVADSPDELQALLDIAAAYASKWRYLFNVCKFFVLVFGESPCSCSRFRVSTFLAYWYSVN